MPAQPLGPAEPGERLGVPGQLAPGPRRRDEVEEGVEDGRPFVARVGALAGTRHDERDATVDEEPDEPAELRVENPAARWRPGGHRGRRPGRRRSDRDPGFASCASIRRGAAAHRTRHPSGRQPSRRGARGRAPWCSRRAPRCSPSPNGTSVVPRRYDRMRGPTREHDYRPDHGTARVRPAIEGSVRGGRRQHVLREVRTRPRPSRVGGGEPVQRLPGLRQLVLLELLEPGRRCLPRLPALPACPDRSGLGHVRRDRPRLGVGPATQLARADPGDRSARRAHAAARRAPDPGTGPAGRRRGRRHSGPAPGEPDCRADRAPRRGQGGPPVAGDRRRPRDGRRGPRRELPGRRRLRPRSDHERPGRRRPGGIRTRRRRGRPRPGRRARRPARTSDPVTPATPRRSGRAARAAAPAAAAPAVAAEGAAPAAGVPEAARATMVPAAAAVAVAVPERAAGRPSPRTRRRRRSRPRRPIPRRIRPRTRRLIPRRTRPRTRRLIPRRDPTTRTRPDPRPPAGGWPWIRPAQPRSAVLQSPFITIHLSGRIKG